MSTSHALERYENQVLLGARMVREYYYPDRQKNLPDWILIFAIRDLLKMRSETSPEELFELLIVQSKVKTQGQLSRYLAASITANAKAADPAEASVYTGSRKFSFAKLSAMAAYITLHGKKVCRTKLNKLLFYSDFVNYFLHGHSISGSRYVRHRFGPALDRYESMVSTLKYTGVIRVKNESGSEESIVARDKSLVETLSIQEMVTIQWVLANLRSMTASEISQYSRRESAYRFTRQDDYIAYEYARILRKLPSRSVR